MSRSPAVDPTRWRGRLPLTLLAVNFLCTLPYWHVYFGVDDEAVLTLGAQRLLTGEWPYYDWATRHTPGSYLTSALFFWLFGTSVTATRALMGIVAALCGLLIFQIGRRTLPGRWAFLPWLLWCGGGLTQFPLLSYHWFGTLWTLLGIRAGVDWVQTGRKRKTLGLAWALALWTLQSDGLAVGLVIGLLWLRFRPPGLGRVLACALGASLLLWLPFLPMAGEVWHENLLDLRKHLPYNRFPYNPRSWLDSAGLLVQPGPSPRDRLAIAGHVWLQSWTYGFYYLLLGLAFLGLEGRTRRSFSPLPWCFLAWALAAGNRQTVAYVAFSCPVVFLCLAALLSRLPRAALWGVMFAVVDAGAALARFDLLARQYRFPVETRSGTLYAQSPDQAAALAQTHRWAERYLPPGTVVLAYPYLCSFYTLEQLRNPLREPVLTPFLYDQADVDAACRRLQEREVPWIVFLGLDPAQMQNSYHIPAGDYAREAERQLQQVTRGYRLVEGGGSLRLYSRDPNLSSDISPPLPPASRKPPPDKQEMMPAAGQIPQKKGRPEP